MVKRRVLFISASDPGVFGGQEVQTLSLMSGLKGEYEFYLVAGDGTFVKRAKEIGVRVSILPLRQKNLLRSVAQVRQVIRQERIDIVHTLEVRGSLIGRLAARYAGERPKLVTTRHELFFSPHFSTSVRLRRWFYLLLERLTAKRTDLFIAVSQATKNELVRYGKVASAKVNIIYNGVDRQAIEAAIHKSPLPDIGVKADMVVGWVGRLVFDKGLADLIVASKSVLHKYPGALFVVIGDGPERASLEAEVGSSGLAEHFRFPGYQANVYPYLARFDIFVLTSYHESLPLGILEAMALGKPVVATRVGGVPEVVEDGESGILVSPGKPSELSAAIEKLLGDTGLRERMGKRGREIVDNKFNIELMLEQTGEAYEKCGATGIG